MVFFAAKAPTWETPEKIKLAQKHAGIIKENLTIKKRTKILEIGCGTGLLGQNFIEDNTIYLGLDTSSAMLDVFEDKFLENPRVELLAQDLEREALAKRYADFDLVISSMAFHHLQSPKAYLKEIKSRLSKNYNIAIIDLMKEDGSFHPDPNSGNVFHFGFDQEEVKEWAKTLRAKLVYFDTIDIIKKNDREYPQFLAILQG